ncbi:MAG: hypothetical protein AB1480_18365 [Nitrospirota bacterium]
MKSRVYRKFMCLFLLSLLNFFMEKLGWSYDDVTNHREMTKLAISQSNITTFLGKNLNIKEGDVFPRYKYLQTSPSGEQYEPDSPFSNVNEGNYKLLIEVGSYFEDHPVYRTGNHFYDPTTGKKLTDTLYKYTAEESALIWGTYYVNNDFNWKKARDYFYYALSENSKDKRNEYWGKLFQSLGHVLHLIQDMGVPAHVRNDAHGLGAGYPEPYESYVKTYYSVKGGYSSVNLPQLTDYWDTKAGKGLAEFTNSNFFSRDTNFDNPEHQPQYSKPTVTLSDQESTETVTDAYGNSEEVTVRYGLGTVIDKYINTLYQNTHLTAYSLWDFDFKKKANERVYSLNDTIHRTYADLLLPRTVGYSAGLLNYFFRGEINLIPDDATGSGYVIVNNTDEDMSGTFELWYDNTSDQRTIVPGATWTLSISKKSSSNNKSENITFIKLTNTTANLINHR